MPTTPGLPDARLPLVSSEIAVVRRYFPDHIELCESGRTSEDADAEDLNAECRVPTRAAVLAHLPTHPVVHFACHGVTDLTDPSLSRLILHDHIENPLSVASLAPLALDQVQLAYLSACQTAAIHTPQLVDEAIHLASAFNLAGYPHVIGTLWEISDRRAVAIAEAFYAGLRRADGSLEFERAASALHHAVRNVSRRRPWAPSLWAGYLHTGA
ncbi:CHAT domain-containing protein [Amycolatopsis sp. NPDC051758]|uniref:CHAT domain-containing protein n=1 Tax=Amycolatopsis sp. NPDC051758 TaxID=3363935 RepID=UPI00379B4265